MLDLDKCDLPFFHETLKINMSLMIANETIDSYLHRKIKGKDTTNFFPYGIQVFMHIRVSTP